MNIYINFVIFRTRGKHRKIFSAENIFKENDFSENIFRRKPFYVEVNGALVGWNYLESHIEQISFEYFRTLLFIFWFNTMVFVLVCLDLIFLI